MVVRGTGLAALTDLCAASSPGFPLLEESTGGSCSIPDFLEIQTQPIQSSANFKLISLLCFLGGSREQGPPEDFLFDTFCLYIHNGLFVILKNEAVGSPWCARHLLGAWHMLFRLLEVMTHFLRNPSKTCL